MQSAALLLVVEDEPMILMDLEDALQEASFQVVTASDAKMAMRFFEERSSEIRAVLTDIRLGNGPSGWDVAIPQISADHVDRLRQRRQRRRVGGAGRAE